MSSDTYRKVYKPLKKENHDSVLIIKASAEILEEIMNKIKNREMSLALTNLEQSIMWATKAVVMFDEKQQEEESAIVSR